MSCKAPPPAPQASVCFIHTPTLSQWIREGVGAPAFPSPTNNPSRGGGGPGLQPRNPSPRSDTGTAPTPRHTPHARPPTPGRMKRHVFSASQPLAPRALRDGAISRQAYTLRSCCLSIGHGPSIEEVVEEACRFGVGLGLGCGCLIEPVIDVGRTLPQHERLLQLHAALHD